MGKGMRGNTRHGTFNTSTDMVQPSVVYGENSSPLSSLEMTCKAIVGVRHISRFSSVSRIDGMRICVSRGFYNVGR
jgi:hypothetical protein